MAIVVSTDNVNLPVNSIQVEGYDVKVNYHPHAVIIIIVIIIILT